MFNGYRFYDYKYGTSNSVRPVLAFEVLFGIAVDSLRPSSPANFCKLASMVFRRFSAADPGNVDK